MLPLLVSLVVLAAAAAAELEVVEVPVTGGLNTTLALKKHALVLCDHAGTSMALPWDLLSLPKLSRMFSTQTIHLNASLCSVRVYAARTCAEVRAMAAEAAAAGLIGSTVSWVVSAWRSDVIIERLPVYAGRCVGVLSSTRCELPVAERHVGVCP